MAKTVYKYKVQSRNLSEFARESEIVGDAYFFAGWKEVGLLFDSSGFPEYMVFEWHGSGTPPYRFIDPASFRQ